LAHLCVCVCVCVCVVVFPTMHLDRKQKGTPCIVTESCRDTMTMFDCPLYSLSHQLLYFLIASMVREHTQYTLQQYTH